jgi:formylglycine-generating enzyme required for sulfatase activity
MHIMEFPQRLSRSTGKNYHLPSEAQWEYACRAGTATAYHFGPRLTKELADYESLNSPMSVGSYSPNRWGFHDMHGNVFEWCSDYWHDNYDGAPTDGSVWLEGGDSSLRVLRGGSWFDTQRNCRSAHRIPLSTSERYFDVGFRIVCSNPSTSQSSNKI